MYLAVWVLGVVVAAIAANTVEDTGNWEDLAAAVWGFFATVLLGHVAWAVVAVRLLRPPSRTGRIVAVVLLTPALVIALGAATIMIFPANVIALCVIPAALTWWAAEPLEAST